MISLLALGGQGRPCPFGVCSTRPNWTKLVPVSGRDIRIARERLLTAQSRQRSYADRRRRDLEFQIGDHVFLKVSPTKGIRRFGIRGKLSPDTLDRLRFWSYIHDPAHVLDTTPLELRDDLSFEEQPLKILAREVKRLRNRKIPYVKVLWSNHDEHEATWELESALWERYPHLFQMDA
uniref:Chromo domain-containing protein n=1 Tax=Ananas comosus var. bracteatus TaxID=296719 RepID=A0A6V7P1V1_ANACO|nr:unnamed protein product [Ananas comosus var. bracteatus]